MFQLSLECYELDGASVYRGMDDVILRSLRHKSAQSLLP